MLLISNNNFISQAIFKEASFRPQDKKATFCLIILIFFLAISEFTSRNSDFFFSQSCMI